MYKIGNFEEKYISWVLWKGIKDIYLCVYICVFPQ